jgi:hypothetical protein
MRVGVKLAEFILSQRRRAQTLPAFFPGPVARLGHATRPGKLQKGKKNGFSITTVEDDGKE